jgi:hypothetical protein
MLLYRYSSRFRQKVRFVRAELQGVGDKIVAFEREAATRARLNIQPNIEKPSDIESIMRELGQMEHKAQLNDYLNLGSIEAVHKNKSELEEFKKYGFVRYLDTSKPVPRPRNLYPSIPSRSEGYSLASEYHKSLEDYEKLPIDSKSRAPKI